jgi:threonine aldolase
MRIIDFRSDTVTQPTPEMRIKMSSAQVGDDVMEEDPTVYLLQSRVARMFGKEEALFFPSGTMSNLTAMLAWCDRRGSEVILGDKSHIYLFEQAGAAQFGGVSYRTLENKEDGTMDLEQIKNAIRVPDIHEPTTQLIAIENTHNVCGGKVLPIGFLVGIQNISEKYSIPIHMDGARIWNALAELQIRPENLAVFADSLTVCLSKGLGAPVGSLLLGSRSFIEKARRIRKALGGGMRQSGILAAAGMVAIDDFESGILHKDHHHARQLADGIKDISGIRIQNDKIDTNILFIRTLLNENYNAYTIKDLLRVKGILVSAWSDHLIRIVIHRDISDEDIMKTIQEFQGIVELFE